MTVHDNPFQSALPTLVTAARDLGAYPENGGTWGQYRFEVLCDHNHLLTIYAGVNLSVHDELTGDKSIFVVDIQAHTEGGHDFLTTHGDSAYAYGLRMGPSVIRNIMRAMVAVVQEDFPEVCNISGHRTSGARWLHRGGMANRTATVTLMPRDLLVPGHQPR